MKHRCFYFMYAYTNSLSQDSNSNANERLTTVITKKSVCESTESMVAY